ncbi:hypothetical protein ACOMHN_039179 [Nucella lapillus]
MIVTQLDVRRYNTGVVFSAVCQHITTPHSPKAVYSSVNSFPNRHSHSQLQTVFLSGESSTSLHQQMWPNPCHNNIDLGPDIGPWS